MKYHIENFGCQMNEHDMEKVASLLRSAGIIPAEDIEAADVVIVNTCCVRQKAEQKFYSLMGRLKHLKRKNGTILRRPINPEAEIHLFGQEVNPETWAVSKSDLFMKDPTGRDADNIAYGSTLSND